MNDDKKPEIRFKEFTDTWEQRKLGEIYKFQYGEFNNNPSNGGIYPVYGANGVIGGYTNYNAENSVIIGHMGEYAGSVLWGNGKHFVTYNGTISKPKGENVTSKFGYYMLYQKDINKICGGSGLPFLSYEQLNKIEVCYPKDIKEQKSIANYLTNIDNLITLHQRKYDKLVNIKKAMLDKMFPKNGKNVPEIRFRGFTDAWEQRKVTDVGKVFIGLVTTMTKNYTDVGTLLIRNSDIKDNHFEFDSNPIHLDEGFAKTNDSRRMHIGDVVTVHTGDVGTSAVITEKEDGSIGFATIVTRPNKEIIDSNYLSTYLNTEQHKNWAINQSTGDGRTNYNLKEFTQLIVPLPSLKEQQCISKYVKQIDNLITLHQRKLEKLKQIKKSLLDKMFI